MKIVLDTNVLISGLINPEGMPAYIVRVFLNGKLTVLYDARIMNEYSEVLSRKKFGFEKSWINPLMDYFRNEGEYINAEPVHLTFADESDTKFYEVAITGHANYLITGNKNHFPDENIIKSPREFIELYVSKEKTEE